MKRSLIFGVALLLCLVASHQVQAQQLADAGTITVTNISGASGIPKKTAPKQAKWNPVAVRLMLALGAKQPQCCKVWDNMKPDQKAGLQHMHGALGSMSGIPILTTTDPMTPDEAHCKGSPCAPDGSKLVKEGKASVCGNSGTKKCDRECGNDGSISGCSRYCCERECACGGCP